MTAAGWVVCGSCAAVVRPAVLPVRVVMSAAFTSRVVAPGFPFEVAGEPFDPWFRQSSLALRRSVLAEAARRRRRVSA